jgi:2-keto-4-pentenoate hydratase/2-oxohepta-3-ene-1,7-dioic acid hydratase in catechol pathway
MRLVRFGPAGAERPGVLVDDEHALDVGDHVRDFDRAFFAAGGIETLRPIVAAGDGPRVPLEGVRLGAPVARPGNIFCIGLNYADHAAEAGLALPPEPIFFIKSSNAISGPFVAGYMVCNDVSEREFQLERGTQWTKGKSFETFNPAGPWLVTPDEVPDPANLDLWTDINGERRQTGNTGTLVFGVPQIIRHLSRYIVLEPGDVIDTGTPPGVAMGRPDKPFLRPGDVMELGITGLGRQRQRLVPAP